MISSSGLRTFNETFGVKVTEQNAELSKRLLIDTAEKVRDRTMAQQASRAGVRPAYAQIVDRRRDAPLQTVRPDGVIVFEWSYLREISSEAVRLLTERGPELKGDWKRSIPVFVDDTAASLSAINERTRLVEVSPVIIYARRLEIGRDKKGGPFVVNAPPHLVQETAKTLARFYRNVANIKHSFVQLAANTGDLKGSARARALAEIRFPAIQIRALPQ